VVLLDVVAAPPGVHASLHPIAGHRPVEDVDDVAAVLDHGHHPRFAEGAGVPRLPAALRVEGGPVEHDGRPALVLRRATTVASNSSRRESVRKRRWIISPAGECDGSTEARQLLGCLLSSDVAARDRGRRVPPPAPGTTAAHSGGPARPSTGASEGAPSADRGRPARRRGCRLHAGAESEVLRRRRSSWPRRRARVARVRCRSRSAASIASSVRSTACCSGHPLLLNDEPTHNQVASHGKDGQPLDSLRRSRISTTSGSLAGRSPVAVVWARPPVGAIANATTTTRHVTFP